MQRAVKLALYPRLDPGCGVLCWAGSVGMEVATTAVVIMAAVGQVAMGQVAACVVEAEQLAAG